MLSVLICAKPRALLKKTAEKYWTLLSKIKLATAVWKVHCITHRQYHELKVDNCEG